MSAPQRKHNTKTKAAARRNPVYAKPHKASNVAETIWKMEENCCMNAIRVVSDPSHASYDRTFLKQLVRAIKKAESQNKHPATDRDVCRFKLSPLYLDLIRGGSIYQADKDDHMTVMDAIVRRSR